MGSFPPQRQCVFVTGAHLGRDAALLAAARVHVKPAALLGPLPVLAFQSSEPRDVQAVLADARSVDVDGWAISGAEVGALPQVRRVELQASAAEVQTSSGPQRIEFLRLAAFVDLRWKAAVERRVQVLVPQGGRPLVLVPSALEVTGASRQAAELKVLVELHQRALAAVKGRVFAQALLPAQVGAPGDVPAEVVAVALAEFLQRRADRLSR
jgi:hypothetical protein